MFIVSDTLVEFDVETVEEACDEEGQPAVLADRGHIEMTRGFEVGGEGDFEGLKGGEDGGGLEVLDCVGEMACSEEEIE